MIYLYSNWHTVQASTCQNFITIATIILPATIILIFYLPPHSFLNYQFLNIHFISHFFSLLFPTISNFSMFFLAPALLDFALYSVIFFFVHHLIKWSFNVRKVVLKCCFFSMVVCWMVKKKSGIKSFSIHKVVKHGKWIELKDFIYLCC